MSTWSDPSYSAIARLVGARTGLSFSGARLVDAESGIRRALKKSGLPNISGYLSKLALESRVFDDLVDELTVHETYFFREPGHFELLRHEVMARLERRSRRDVRAWCAGCASGEEAYSVAILFEELDVSAESTVLATDISRAALARARAARYRPWSFRGVDPSILDRWFRRDVDAWVLDPRVVARVDLEHLNLALDSFPSFATRTSGLDFILCRNVLIYLDPAVIERIALRLFESLAPGGLLLPGPSDPPLGHIAPFDTLITPAGLVYRKPGLTEGFAPLFSPSVLSRIPALGAAVEPASVPAPVPVPAYSASPDRSPPPSTTALDGVRRILERNDTAVGSEGEQAERAQQVRDLANRTGSAAAVELCRAAIAAHPLSVELHHLAAMLAIAVGREDDALASLRRTIYLDRTLAIAHFTLGTLHQQRGELVAARRAYGNAHELAAARPSDEPLPLAEGVLASAIVRETEVTLAKLDELLGRAPEEEP